MGSRIRTFGTVLGLVVAFGALAAPESELIEFWDASDESNTEIIDHSAWQNILDGYLDAEHPSGISRFDYAALKANTADFDELKAYLVGLSQMDPRTYSNAEQMAYWINLYNALTVFVVVGDYPVDTIRDIKSGILDWGPWNKELLTIAGEALTLNNIEHGILRPRYMDPRIHYAVNCASIGCPNLASQAYTSANMEELLEQGASDYINHARGVTEDDGELLISSIYEWFKADFGDSDEGVIAHLQQYAQPRVATILEKYTSFDDDYDWQLNAP